MSNGTKGLKWYNNGIQQKYFKQTDIIPKGWLPGKLSMSATTKLKLSKCMSGKNNPFFGKTHSLRTKRLLSKLMKGNKHNLGTKFSIETKQKIGLKSKERNSGKGNPAYGTIWYNNGIEQKQFKKDEAIPKGWICGTLMKGKHFSDDFKIKISKAKVGKYLTADKLKEKLNKEYQTKKNNKSFNSSKDSEEVFKRFLIDNNITFEQPYRDARYPFNCDFYIPKLDLFIELNHTWSHGEHLFNNTNKADINKLAVWKEKAKTSNYYKAAINVWTKRDPLKFETARKNNLNYWVSYNKDEMQLLMKKLLAN